MKKLIFNFLLIIPVLLIVNCSNKDRDLKHIYPGITSEGIENNDISKAVSTDPSKTIVGFFMKNGVQVEPNFYKVKFVDRSVSYEVVLTAVPGVDSRIRIFDRNKKLVFNVDEQGTGESEKLWELIPKDEFIYLQIDSKSGYNDRIPYAVNFIKKQENRSEEIEPNNTEEEANLIKLNDSKKGYISPKDDIDYYKIIFDDDKNHDFSIELESFSNLDVSFTVINKKNGKTKKIDNFQFGGTEVFPYLSSVKGEYYIKVEGHFNESIKKDPIYYISIKELKNSTEDGKQINYEQEFNDDPDSASDLISGNEVVGLFFPEKDEDWFKFDLYKKPVSVDLSLSRVKNLDPTIEIYDFGKKLITTVNNNGRDNG